MSGDSNLKLTDKVTKGILVLYCDDLVINTGIEYLGNKSGTDTLDFVGTALSCRQYR